MIFDAENVTPLVLMWQQTRDPVLLDRIVSLSVPLIEAIVSGFATADREDAIQDAVTKVIFSLSYYSANYGSLHTYLTTVIRNSLATTFKKDNRPECDDIELYEEELGEDIKDCDIMYDLEELTIRNRKRFPSLPVDILDEVTEFIYYELLGGTNSRSIIAGILKSFMLDKYVATIVYNSSKIYLRSQNLSRCKKFTEVAELSLLADLRDIIGNDSFSTLSAVFSGITLKFP